MSALPNLEQAESPPIVAIVGATGTGKSECAIAVAETLAERGYRAEIVNADAMQLYRGMDIGTAKVPPAERRGVVHHLLDVWEVTLEASVADYQALARVTIADIQSRGVVPILVGGSGLYVSAVVYEFEFPGTDKDVRAGLEARLEAEGRDALVAELMEKDPLAAAAIDPHNVRRVIRALEVIEVTGKPFGAGLDAERRAWQRTTHIVGLRAPRDELVGRLDARVERMWASGLLDEVRGLIPQGIERGVTASRAIGYQQALAVVHGTLSEADALADTQSLTRRYARRQVSWFGRNTETRWCESDDPGVPATVAAMILGSARA